MATIANLKINIIASTYGLERGLRKTRAAIRKFRRSLNQTFGQGVRIAMVAAAAAIGVVILATKKMIAIFSDFEFKMQEVRSILLDVSDRTFARLVTQARKLGATTVFTASQAGQAMAFLARAGFNVNEVMAATPALLDLAAAATMDLAEAADITAQVVRGMGLEASEAARVADVLAYTSARTNTTVQQLGAAFGYVAPVAAALNISLEETAAMLGVLSNAGMQADRAGTGLKNVLAELAGEIERHGIAALKKFTEGGIGVERAFEIFQKRGGPAIINLFKMHHITNKLVKEMKDVEGVARKMADIRMDSVHGAFKLLSSVVQELNIVIGEKLRGTIRNIQEALRRWVVGFTSSIKAVIDGVDLTSLSVEKMLVWLEKVLVWVKTAWDKISRLGSLVISVIHTVAHVLIEAIGYVMKTFDFFILLVTHGLELIGVVAWGTANHMEKVFEEAYKEMERQAIYHSEAAINAFDDIFEEGSRAVSDFMDRIIRDVRKAGKTPIILTMEGHIQTVVDETDVAVVEKVIEHQLEAVQTMIEGMVGGVDEKAYEAMAKARKAKLEPVVATSPYGKMAKELEVMARKSADARMQIESDQEELTKIQMKGTPITGWKGATGTGKYRQGYVHPTMIDYPQFKEDKKLKSRLKKQLEEQKSALSDFLQRAEQLKSELGSTAGEAAAKKFKVLTDALDKVESELDVFTTKARLVASSVVGPGEFAVSQLEDVKYEMEAVGDEIHALMAMPPEAISNITEWTLKVAELNILLEELADREKAIQEVIDSGQKTVLDDMREQAEFLELALTGFFHPSGGLPGMGLGAPPVPAEELEEELSYLNSRIAEYIVMVGKVQGEHDRIIDVRGKYFDSLEVEKVSTALEDSITDWNMLHNTIDMTTREAEIFAASLAGVPQHLLDSATYADFLLTSLEKAREESERLEKFGDEVRKSLEGPQDVFDTYIKDLDAALAAGEISWRTHLLAKGKAEKDLAADLGKATMGSVVGIQTALGTMKVGGATNIQSQLAVATSSLAQQTLTNTTLSTILNKGLPVQPVKPPLKPVKPPLKPVKPPLGRVPIPEPSVVNMQLFGKGIEKGVLEGGKLWVGMEGMLGKTKNAITQGVLEGGKKWAGMPLVGMQDMVEKTKNAITQGVLEGGKKWVGMPQVDMEDTPSVSLDVGTYLDELLDMGKESSQSVADLMERLGKRAAKESSQSVADLMERLGKRAVGDAAQSVADVMENVGKRAVGDANKLDLGTLNTEQNLSAIEAGTQAGEEVRDLLKENMKQILSAVEAGTQAGEDVRDLLKGRLDTEQNLSAIEAGTKAGIEVQKRMIETLEQITGVEVGDVVAAVLELIEAGKQRQERMIETLEQITGVEVEDVVVAVLEHVEAGTQAAIEVQKRMIETLEQITGVEVEDAVAAVLEHVEAGTKAGIEVQKRMIETLEQIIGVEVEDVEKKIIDDGLSGVSDAVGELNKKFKKPAGEDVEKKQHVTAKESLVEQKSTNVKFTELITLVRTGSGALT